MRKLCNELLHCFTYAIGNNAITAKPILAKFANCADWIEYTTEILDLLCTDPHIETICDNTTGIIIYDKTAKYIDSEYKRLEKYL